jgi:hypothetical protein
MGRYVPVTSLEFASLMGQMGFRLDTQAPGNEETYFRQVESRDGKRFNAFVRIFSSITKGDAVSREVGADAIRLVLLNAETGKPLGESVRVFRTKNALINARERARDLFREVLAHPCEKCGTGFHRVIVKGQSKFRGCSNFPACTATSQYKE